MPDLPADRARADLSPLSDALRRAMTEAGAPRALPQHRRLYAALRSLILGRRLAPGTRLPSTRALAHDLRIARNTVIATFETLLAEGYLRARTGSGTFVADASETGFRSTAAPTVVRAPARAAAALSKRGTQLAGFDGGGRLEIQPLTGEDDFSLFPLRTWQRLHARQMRLPQAALLDFAAGGGWAPLRGAIADYVRVTRAVRVAPEQVLVTAGTQHSLELCAQLLADPGDAVAIEEPGYWGARCVFGAAGLQAVPLPVDDEGAQPAGLLAARAPRPRLVYLTPSNQYPLGVALALPRRQALLALAARDGAWILEDDYDSEFRFAGRPLASLQGMDPHGRVVYLGTFSKVLYPGIKVGYLVLPEALVAPFRRALYDLQRPGQVAVQAALAAFMAQGGFATHVRRLRLAYAERREALLAALAPVLARPGVRLLSQASGLHLTLQLPKGFDDAGLARRAADAGLRVRPLSAYYAGRPALAGVVAGYAYTDRARLADCGAQLAALLGEALAGAAGAAVATPTSARLAPGVSGR